MSKSIVKEVKEKAPSVVPNLDRILRTLSDQESFYFYKATGQPIGEKAVSLVDFATKIKTIDSLSLAYHYYRGDFEKWLKDTVKDPVLASMLSVKERTNLKGEPLRDFINQQLRARFNDFKMEIS